MMTNEDRQGYGYEAVRVGSPDAGKNGDDADGRLTDAGDAIANILHFLWGGSFHDDLSRREEYVLQALDKGKRHFQSEIRGVL